MTLQEARIGTAHDTDTLIVLPDRARCLCRIEDGAVFAHVERGMQFVRTSDRELWAIERDDMLVSARSGLALAYRRGKVFFSIDTDEPIYYERAI